MQADKRFAAALACSLVLHALLIASLRVGGVPAQLAGRNSIPLLVYLRADATPPPKARGADSGQQNTSLRAPSREQTLLPEITADERYLLSSEIDVRAQPIRMPVLVYPEHAQQMKIDGLVRLRVYIGKSGKIDAVDIVASEPPGVFEDAALKALLSTSFTPAQKNGHPVKSQKLIEIKFDPYDTASAP